MALGVLLAGPGPAPGQPRPLTGGPTAPNLEPPSRRVLLLYGEPRLTPAIVAVDAAVRSTLASRSPTPVTFYTEYLDLNLFHEGVPLPELRELLRRKYETRPFDLILVAGSRALRIALQNRADLFSNAPVVFISVDPTAIADLRLDGDVTGTWLHQGWVETLELARRLQPGIRRAVVVTGSSPADRVWREAARTQLAAGAPIEVAYLSDLGLEELLARARDLPRHTVLLVGPFRVGALPLVHRRRRSVCWWSRAGLIGGLLVQRAQRRRAQQSLAEREAQIRDLAGRLMSAQEEERRRIARDLHDDASQELAALSIALSGLGDRLPAGAAAELRDEIGRLQARTVTLAEGIRHLSHELHPGVLQHVGVAVALRSYCSEFARAHGLRVTFRAEAELGMVPTGVGLCLYRVVQEGLGNVAKHAAAREAYVKVGRVGTDVVLAIADDGCGFDPALARGRRGLGLVSLDERVRLVGGRLTVDTKPSRGAELRVVVPLPEVEDAPRDGAAG